MENHPTHVGKMGKSWKIMENVRKHLGNGANILETYMRKMLENIGRMSGKCAKHPRLLCANILEKPKLEKYGMSLAGLNTSCSSLQWVCLKNRGPKNVTIDQNLPLQNCHKLRDPTNFEITPN